MSEAMPWIVVSHAADHTPPAVAAEHLIAWLAQEGNFDLHTVVWTAGPRGTAPYEVGRLVDVGQVRRRLLAHRLERIGLRRVGGGLRGRSVRSVLQGVPSNGVLYLSSGFAGSVLRYLPPGRRTVLTHLHALDRMADPPLGTSDIERLKAATTVWLATDGETAAWATERWDLAPGLVTIVPAPVDPRAWTRPLGEPDRFRLGLAGAAWFRTDHTPRLVQAIGRRRPEVDLALHWAQGVVDPRHLDPMRHDLRQLGFDGSFELPPPATGPLAALDRIDALALTSPDDEAPWVAWEAAARGVPIVCFDTHRAVPSVVAGAGVVVPYPDVRAMADALLDVHDDDGTENAVTTSRRRAALRDRDVAVVGPQIVHLAEEPAPDVAAMSRPT